LQLLIKSEPRKQASWLRALLAFAAAANATVSLLARKLEPKLEEKLG